MNGHIEYILSDPRLDVYDKGKLRNLVHHNGDLCPSCLELIDMFLAGEIFVDHALEELKMKVESIEDNMFNSFDVKEIAEEAASREVREWVKKYQDDVAALTETIDKLVEYLSKKKTLNIRGEVDITSSQIVKTLKSRINFRSKE